MLKSIRLATSVIISMTAGMTAASAADWRGDVNIAAQGVRGFNASTDQYGSFRLDFYCTAHEGENRTIFMKLLTLPDAPLEPGNETSFPVIMRYTFSNDAPQMAEIMVDWVADDYGSNVWNATFPMDKRFLDNFARAQMLSLTMTNGDIITQYGMSGSAKAANDMTEYCYSGDYAYE